jgi:peptidoglycan/LPS O-acetylase OafA/YrhL
MAAIAMVLAPLARIVTWYWIPSWEWSIGTAFQTNVDALAAGCVLAGLWTRLSSSTAYLRFLNSKLFSLVPISAIAAGVLLSSEDPRLVFASYLLGQTVLNVSIALMIDRCVRYESDAVGRLLNWKPVVFVGVLSYSLYLWQEPFLNRLANTPANWFPLNLILVAAAALGSYYLVEKPFLKLRRKLEGSTAANERVMVVPAN